jgi:hypothetical protein
MRTENCAAQATRPRPSLPVLGLDAVSTDVSLGARQDERKVAYYEAQRSSLLNRLQSTRDRTSTPMHDRLQEEVADLQQLMWSDHTSPHSPAAAFGSLGRRPADCMCARVCGGRVGKDVTAGFCSFDSVVACASYRRSTM